MSREQIWELEENKRSLLRQAYRMKQECPHMSPVGIEMEMYSALMAEVKEITTRIQTDKSVAETKVAHIFNSAKFSNKKARNFMEICQKLRHNTPDFAQHGYVYRRSLLSLWL